MAFTEFWSNSSWLISSLSILGLSCSLRIYSYCFTSYYANFKDSSIIQTYLFRSTGSYYALRHVVYSSSSTLSLIETLAFFCYWDKCFIVFGSSCFKSFIWLLIKGCKSNNLFNSFWPSVNILTSSLSWKKKPQSSGSN